MGFADYLSRNALQPSPPPSSDDTQFIINTILLNDTIEKVNVDKYQTRNEVTHSKALTAQKTNIFCQTRENNQSLANIST